MTTGTIIAIVAPNLVTATAIVVGRLQHRDALSQERRLDDLAEVRGVFDEGAVLLHRISYVLDVVRSDLSGYGSGFFKSESRVKTYNDLEEIGREADALGERLAVRLGADHEVVVAFRSANEAALSIFRALGLLKLEPPADPGTAAVQQVRELGDRTRADVTAQRSTFDAHRNDFMVAAHQTAGAALRGAI